MADLTNLLDLLEGVGLTRGEAKVYLSLLELGSSTTGGIIKRAKVSRSKVYEMLDRLIDRGLVSFVIKENMKYFEAAEPDHIIHYIRREKTLLEKKEEAMKKLLPVLKQKKKFAKTPQTATVYEGIKGIKTIYSEIIYSLKKNEEYYAIAAEPELFDNEEFIAFIKNYHKRREERGIKVKLLAPIKSKSEVSKIFAGIKLIKIRYYDNTIPSAMLFFRDNVATYVWDKNQCGVVIKSQIISKRYKEFFEKIWSQSKY